MNALRSNTLCSLFYCYQQLCVLVHVLDPKLSSPASILLSYSPSLLFSSGRMLLVFLMYMTRKNWVASLAGHAMRSSSRGSHDLQNPCKEGLLVLYLVYCSLSPLNIGAACRDTNPSYSLFSTGRLLHQHGYNSNLQRTMIAGKKEWTVQYPGGHEEITFFSFL